MSTDENNSIAIEDKLEQLGLILPEKQKLPPGIKFPFLFVRINGNRAYISGHVPLNPDGSIALPLGKVGAELTLEEGYHAAQLKALSILSNLKRELGELDRIVAWLRVFGMVNSAPGFIQQPQVINGFSDLILKLYGPDKGFNARCAVGMAELPNGVPVEIEAEVEIII
jgi:enamine deaminase RidA (YjgF/YER057c/UK114 family)